jgi:hypothetical protein
MAKQLEYDSAIHGKRDGKNSGYPARPKRLARPERPDVQAGDDVIETGIVSSDFADRSDDAEPEIREEDLGR